MAMYLLLEVVLLPVVDCFFEAIGAMEKAFLERFLIFGRKILSVGTQISIKAPVYGGDFSPQVIGQMILATSQNKNGN